MFNVCTVRIRQQPDVSATVGQDITLPCTTSPGKSGIWWYQASPGPPISDIFNVRGDAMNGYRRSGRFNLRRDTDVDYSLVITNVNLSDAGLYTCIIDDGYGEHRVTKLSVAGTPVTHPIRNVHIMTDICIMHGHITCVVYVHIICCNL